MLLLNLASVRERMGISCGFTRFAIRKPTNDQKKIAVTCEGEDFWQ